MSEEELDSKEEDFQQKMIEFMMSAKTQFEAMNGQMQKLAEGMRAAEKRLEIDWKMSGMLMLPVTPDKWVR